MSYFWVGLAMFAAGILSIVLLSVILARNKSKHAVPSMSCRDKLVAAERRFRQIDSMTSMAQVRIIVRTALKEISDDL